jgi:predicted DNA-binding transcriptional regulator AlpA
MRKRLRFRDLKARGIVNNRPTLNNWIKKLGFPPGQLTGPNTRTWDEGEVEDYLASRPTAPKPTPTPSRRPGRPRKAECVGGVS